MTANERWRQTKKNLKTVEQKKDSLTRSEPLRKNSNGRAEQGAKQDLLNRWNNSQMTSSTKSTDQKRTIEMYERALSGPPSKEWQEKKRKEESRKAAEAAAAQAAPRGREEAAKAAARAREEASKRGGGRGGRR